MAPGFWQAGSNSKQRARAVLTSISKLRLSRGLSSGNFTLWIGLEFGI